MTSQNIQTELVVIGSGPGGYTAAFRAADLGKKVVLVEKSVPDNIISGTVWEVEYNSNIALEFVVPIPTLPDALIDKQFAGAKYDIDNWDLKTFVLLFADS